MPGVALLIALIWPVWLLAWFMQAPRDKHVDRRNAVHALRPAGRPLPIARNCGLSVSRLDRLNGIS
jgi:hypothetical protein